MISFHSVKITFIFYIYVIKGNVFEYWNNVDIYYNSFTIQLSKWSFLFVCWKRIYVFFLFQLSFIEEEFLFRNCLGLLNKPYLYKFPYNWQEIMESYLRQCSTVDWVLQHSQTYQNFGFLEMTWMQKLCKLTLFFDAPIGLTVLYDPLYSWNVREIL